MTHYLLQDNPDDYKLYKQFYTNFFINKTSYFDSSIQFSEDTLKQYEQAIFENYIEGIALKFDEKIREQLNGKSKELRHFAANLLWIYNFFLSSTEYRSYKVDKKLETKVREVENILGIEVEYNLFPQYGYANAGQAYKTKKYEELAYYYLFTKKVFLEPLLLTNEHLKELLQFVETMNIKKDLPQNVFRTLNKTGAKNILLFLLAPDKYEPIISYSDKAKIVEAFSPNNKDSLNDALSKIRQDQNITDSFYSAKNINKWKHNNSIPSASVLATNVATPTTRSRKTSIEDNDDLHNAYTEKLETGLSGEIIVAEFLYNKFLQNLSRAHEGQSTKLILDALEDLGYSFEDIKNNILNKSLKEISHFSKNIHTKAPFDIIYTKSNEVFFVEVKSTSSLSNTFNIYFSINEIKFALENSENYEIFIVANGQVFELENEQVLNHFNNIIECNLEHPSLTIEQISLSLSLNKK